MNIRWFAILLVVPFVAFTAYSMSVSQESLLSFGYRLLSSPDTAQVVIDLYILALLAIVWMYFDCRKRESKAWLWMPCAALTLVFVSAGPLLYLILRPSDVGSAEL